MKYFLQSSDDYMIFFHGFSLILLSVTTLWPGRSQGTRMPWRWLGLFGVAYGVSEWLNIINFSLRDMPVFSVLRLTILIISFIFILEFARRGPCLSNHRVAGRWLYVLLVVLALLGGFDGMAGLHASIRYALGLGCLCSAWSLWEHRHRHYPQSIALLTAAGAMALYALATGIIVPEASFPPASFLNETSFLAVTGLPVQLIRGMLATILGIHVWIHYGNVYCSIFPELKRLYQYNNVVWFSGLLFIVLCIGWLLTMSFGGLTSSNLRDKILNSAQTLAASLNPSRILSLQGNIHDADTADYASLKQQLESAKGINSNCRFIYICALKAGKVILLVDAEPADSKDFSPPGQVYGEAPPALFEIFTSGVPATTAPYHDRWGTWVSAFVPIRDHVSSQIIAILGQDIDTRDWRVIIARSRLLIIFITLLIMTIAVGYFIVHQNNHENMLQIGSSEARYRGLVEGSPNGVFLIDSEGRYVSINQHGLEAMGWGKEHLLGKRFIEIWPEEVRSRVEDAVHRVLRGEKSTFEAAFIRPDGSTAIWHVVLNPIADTAQVVRSFVGISIDITERKLAEAEREKLIVELREALDSIKTLKGLVPICASCKKIRDDQGYWEQIEIYIQDHSDAEFTHGLCPECGKKLYPDLYEDT